MVFFFLLIDCVVSCWKYVDEFPLYFTFSVIISTKKGQKNANFQNFNIFFAHPIFLGKILILMSCLWISAEDNLYLNMKKALKISKFNWRYTQFLFPFILNFRAFYFLKWQGKVSIPVFECNLIAVKLVQSPLLTLCRFIMVCPAYCLLC